MGRATPGAQGLRTHSMDAWFHCENPYPFVPDDVLEATDSVRASLPNRYCDPKVAAQLFEETLDEYLLCDELGLNITSSEHHAGINCLYGASPVVLGIVARQTKNIRLLSMGTLVTVRNDPVRVAEEYATADVISRGRLEIGFVKSGGTEMASGNANPIGIRERFWEAIDLIGKSLTHQEGPFSWEGKHFTHRHVNIWPRPYQQPHPPMWAATSDPVDTAELGRRGMVNIMVMRGVDVTRRAWAPIAMRGWRPGCRSRRPTASATRPLSMSAIPTRKGCGSAASCCGSSTPA
jgi:alkanesulfonate monooxygenase SsuD/methylene tetrahydromethanopterin reductase-like flavin-dependent oxidoreductase (luciferase family)